MTRRRRIHAESELDIMIREGSRPSDIKKAARELGGKEVKLNVFSIPKKDVQRFIDAIEKSNIINRGWNGILWIPKIIMKSPSEVRVKILKKEVPVESSTRAVKKKVIAKLLKAGCLDLANDVAAGR